MLRSASSSQRSASRSWTAADVTAIREGVSCTCHTVIWMVFTAVLRSFCSNACTTISNEGVREFLQAAPHA